MLDRPPDRPPSSRSRRKGATANAKRLARFHRREAEGRSPMVRTQPRYARFVEALIVSGQLSEHEALDHANVEAQATALIERWSDEMLRRCKI